MVEKVIRVLMKGVIINGSFGILIINFCCIIVLILILFLILFDLVGNFCFNKLEL